MTSLRGPGQRNFNAVSHKPTRAPIQFNSICSRQLWFMGCGIKISFPGPRNGVTDHLERQQLFCSAHPPPLPSVIFPEGSGGSSVHRLLYCNLCTYQYGSLPSTPQPRILIACPPRAPPLVCRYTPTVTRKEN